jgi:heterodisulfide reductase subunit B
MDVVYYPGCTLNTKAKNLGELAKISAKELDINMIEPEEWTCCQAVFPLVTDNLMGLVSATRILINASKMSDKLTTLCAFCYNVLKRTNKVLKENDEVRKRISDYLEEEYAGGIEVVHLLEIVRDDIGYDKLADSVTQKLEGLKVAPYYGCQLLRPYNEIQMDNPENPQILDDFLNALGCDVRDFPLKTECCGSYQVINPESKDVAIECSFRILKSSILNDAEAIAVSCPLCYFNLDSKQKEMEEMMGDLKNIPVFYFSELLAIAMGVKEEMFDFDLHYIDPRPLLLEKGLIQGKAKEEGKEEVEA